MRARSSFRGIGLGIAAALLSSLLVGCGESQDGAAGSPTPTPPDVSAARISAGGYHTCALATDGTVSCWGLGDYGQLGTGSTETMGTPGPVNAPEGVTFTSIVAGNAHTCAIANDGSVWCWGIDLDGTHDAQSATGHAPERVALPTEARVITLDGYYHECATTEDGAVWCWGRNEEGQLGDGGTSDSAVPVLAGLPEGARAVQVVTGAYHSCALTDDGAVWCWGQDIRQQLDGAAIGDTSFPGPVALPESITVTSLTAGFNHTCALASDGAVWCWGEGTSGQLGDGTSLDSSDPVEVRTPDGVSFVAIDAGNAHTCAIATDGSVWCWGLGVAGGADQEGINAVPVLVSIDGAAAASVISAGGFHTCVITVDGAAWCWGDDSTGQLGSGTIGSVGVPVLVDGWMA